MNASRGEVINEQDLLRFKQVNPKSHLVLDVWCNEPNIEMSLLQQTTIATPHIAGYSLDGKVKATRMLYDAVSEFFDLTTAEALKLPGQDKQLFDLPVDADMVELAVLQSYDVRSDAAALYNLENIAVKQRAEYFDSLRKHYPIRREFTNQLIRTVDDHNKVKQLQDLGFTLELI